MNKIIHHGYLCDGKPRCFGMAGCGLADSKYGTCFHTQDISHAKNRKKLFNDPDYVEKHMKLVLSNEYEETYMESEE